MAEDSVTWAKRELAGANFYTTIRSLLLAELIAEIEKRDAQLVRIRELLRAALELAKGEK